MAAHRYWRLYITSVKGLNAVYIKSLKLFSDSNTNLGVNGNGTPMGESGPDYTNNYGPHAAFAGFVMGTGFQGIYWTSVNTEPSGTFVSEYIGWDFGAGNERDVKKISVTNADYHATNTVFNDAVFQYSDDATTWTDSFPIIGNAGISAVTYAPPEKANVNISSPAPLLYAFGGLSARLVAPTPTLKFFGGATANVLAPQFSLAAFGGATANLVSASPTLSASGHNSSGENDFAGVAPMASLVFAGGANARLTAPRPVLSVSARFTAVGKANLKAPAPLLAATGTVPTLAKAALSAPMASLVFLGGGNGGLTAPSPALAITGTVTGWGSAALAAPSSQLTASGTTSAVASAALSAPMASVIGYSGAVCSITLTGKPTLQATGTSGGVGNATLTCPLFELTTSGTRQNVGQANLIAPSPRMGATAQAWLIAPGAVLTAIGTAVVTATYEAYSVNLKHAARAGSNEALIDEVTRYTNFPFDRIVRYQNSYFGVAADGLYLLEGTTDDGAAIACTVKTHISDFDAPEKKTVVSAHIGGRFGPTATVTLHVGETGQTAYSYTTPRGQLAQNYREKFGRGIKDRYFGLEVATTGALEIDQLELEINKLTRRI